MKRFNKFLDWMYFSLASKTFFFGIIFVLVVSACWIALSAQYPMAFDEDFHFGLIKLYASHISPFWSEHPAKGDAFGAVARDPSYLYHYAMSFIYRFVRVFTDNQTVQVLVLRAFNIALFVSCLPILRKLLLQAGASSAVANTCLALFILTPITPFLAAQINYDNLILPLIGLLLLTSLRLVKRLEDKKTVKLLQIAGLGLAGSLIKYAFVPIFIGVIFWLVWQLKPWHYKLTDLKLLKIPKTPSNKLLLVTVVILSVLAGERYGVNLVQYHDPIPNCGQVLTLEHCKSYGPYIRDYTFAAAKSSVNANPIAYTQHWLYGMWFRSFFAVDGPKSLFETRGPFVVPAVTAVAIIVIGLIAFAFKLRSLYKLVPASTGLFLLVIIIYVAALWHQEYKEYLYTGLPVAINGRYLLLILIPAMFLMISSLGLLLKNNSRGKVLMTAACLVLLASSGGALTYILRSSDTWYWNNSATRSVNHAVKRVLNPITPGSDNPTAFLH